MTGCSSRTEETLGHKILIENIIPKVDTNLRSNCVRNADRFMLAWLLGTDAAGFYVAGYDLADQSLVMLMMIVNLAAYPRVPYAVEKKGTEAATLQLSPNITALVAIALPAASGLVATCT